MQKKVGARILALLILDAGANSAINVNGRSKEATVRK
jgi:hypothetical protein